MPMIEPSDEHRKFMALAYAEAKTGFEEGGLPIGGHSPSRSRPRSVACCCRVGKSGMSTTRRISADIPRMPFWALVSWPYSKFSGASAISLANSGLGQSPP